MPNKFTEITFTDTVKKVQEAQGSRKNYARLETDGQMIHHVLGERESTFIALRDSFYMASVGETGWPYVQHRGGPAGFVKVLDEKHIGFADFRGNRQYVSVGNFMTDNRVALFFMDYLNKTRLKMLGRVGLVDAGDTDMLSRLAVPDYRGRVERGILITIEGFDWNCPAHITQRLTLDEVAEVIIPLQDRIRELEARQP